MEEIFGEDTTLDDEDVSKLDDQSHPEVEGIENNEMETDEGDSSDEVRILDNEQSIEDQVIEIEDETLQESDDGQLSPRSQDHSYSMKSSSVSLFACLFWLSFRIPR